MPCLLLMVLFSLKRPDQPAPLKKKFHVVLHYIWLMVIEKLEGVFVCEIPPGIPTQKNNVKYLQEFPFQKAT